MILRIEIETSTPSGNKVHEFIESLKNKEGIKYVDFDDDYFLTDEEFRDLEKETIKKLEEKYEQSHKDHQIKTFKKDSGLIRRNRRVAGIKT